MALHVIKKGLNLPIAGEPDQVIQPGRAPRRVALLAADYHGMKPTMLVAAGDSVKRGQALFEDKKTPGVMYTAPGAGTVLAVNRGERRAFQSLVIELSEAERPNKAAADDAVSFAAYAGKEPTSLSSEEVKALLLESGLWTSLRTRPFSKVANPATTPHSIFVTAMDTTPLAPSVDVVFRGNEDFFRQGVTCVAKLTTGKTYVCVAADSPVKSAVPAEASIEEFQGIHPAGTPGFHIHTLDPVNLDKTVWYLNYQDVIAIGKLFTTGRLDVERVIALAGPGVVKPRLLRSRLGVSLDDLVEGELKEGEHRVIAGSVLSGRACRGDVFGYLGRYHNQVSVVREGRQREFLGWLAPGKDKFSVVNVFLSRLSPGGKFEFTTSLNGSARAMVPIGVYERVMPMDLMATFLLRALVIGDVEQAAQLGCLELDEEDLGPCTFVCPSKYDYAVYLRQILTQIEKEG